jgi:RNA polymerase sigma-70 factor (ECF subfamily)
VVALYEQLERLDPSPLHALHGAIAVSYAQGPAVALQRLQALEAPAWLKGSHLWLATWADLHRRLGQLEPARALYEQAIARAPPLERSVLQRRLAEVQPGP